MSLLGSKSEPRHRSLMVLGNASSFSIHLTQKGLAKTSPVSARVFHLPRAGTYSPLLCASKPFFQSALNPSPALPRSTPRVTQRVADSLLMQGLWHENREMRSLGRFLLKPPIPHKGSDNKNLTGSAYYRGEHPLLALAHPNDPSQFIYYFISQRAVQLDECHYRH